MESKIYSILMVVNYKNNSPSSSKWITIVDTIQNNLLGNKKKDDDNWIEFTTPLPNIKTSVVDIVESADEAIEYLKKISVDVIIMEDTLGSLGIGVGTLSNLKKYAPDAMYIMLLDKSQKKGALLADGTFSRGRKVSYLYSEGYYNAMYKNEISVSELINMITSGGYDKDRAALLYGLNVKKEDNKEKKEEPLLEEHKDTAFVIEDENVKPDILNKKPKEEENTPDNDTKTFPTKKVDFKKINYLPCIVTYVLGETVILKKDDGILMPNEDIINNPVAIPYLNKDKNKPPICFHMANVVFFQDDTIILKSERPLADSNLSRLLLTGMPSYIPYDDAFLSYIFLNVSFIQDKTIILHSPRPLKNEISNINTLTGTDLFIPYEDEKEGILLLKGKITHVLDDTVVVLALDDPPKDTKGNSLIDKRLVSVPIRSA